MDKVSLRNELLTKISLLSNETIQSLSFSLTNQLVKFLESFPTLSGQIGAGYLPFKSEIAPVYQELFKSVPVSLAYPILVEGQMHFGLPQGIPKGGTWLSPPYVEVEPSWLLVPGVGFDLAGARLGRGKGFYDRYLQDRNVVKIGLTWTEQIVSKIPVESHDSHMDFLITEKYCWDVNRQTRF